MSESSDKSARSHAWSLAAIVGGLALVGLSLIWPKMDSGRSQWSDEQAREYQAAAAAFHGLSHELMHEAEDGVSETELRKKFDAAEAEFQVIHSQLEAARQSPLRMAFVLRMVGIVLVIAGVIGQYGPRIFGR